MSNTKILISALMDMAGQADVTWFNGSSIIEIRDIFTTNSLKNYTL